MNLSEIVDTRIGDNFLFLGFGFISSLLQIFVSSRVDDECLELG